MGKQYLIDSNVIIDYIGGKFENASLDFMNLVMNEGPLVSVISKIEVLGFNAPTEELKVLEDFFRMRR